MMYAIRARNVNEAYPLAMQMIKQECPLLHESRNGPVRVLPEPLAIHYMNPRERVLFDPLRDANPYFHFMESLWMLAGRNDVEWISQFTSKMAQYSDNGWTLHGAYGYRWRGGKLGPDQVPLIIGQLTKDPSSRRAVIQMWNSLDDLNTLSKDIPCNLVITFQIQDMKLNMTVFNRSNDLILGALGANVVHFSVLQEFIANALGVEVGWYEQVTANAHVYDKEWIIRGFAHQTYINSPVKDQYQINTASGVEPYKGINVQTDLPYFEFLKELSVWCEDPTGDSWQSEFLAQVATPLFCSHAAYKRGDFDTARKFLLECEASDWTHACWQWLVRREARRSLDSNAAHGTPVMKENAV
jgi:hypothetical protein